MMIKHIFSFLFHLRVNESEQRTGVKGSGGKITSHEEQMIILNYFPCPMLVWSATIPHVQEPCAVSSPHLLFIPGWPEGRNGVKNKERAPVYIRCCFSIPVTFLFLEKYTTQSKIPGGLPSPLGLDFETLIRDTLGPALFSFLYSVEACGNKLVKRAEAWLYKRCSGIKQNDVTPPQ